MASAFEDHAEDGAYNAHYDRPAVLALVGDVRGRRVLDAGCGPGFYAEELARRGADVVAVDASEEMVARAKRRLGGSAHVLRVDLDEALPFEAEAFELVVCPLVIHHLRDRASAFEEFFRVLRPGGRMVLSTHHPTTDWLRKGGSYFDVREEEDAWGRGGGEQHTYRFWREPLTSLCGAISHAGFLIERLVEPQPAESMRGRWPEDWKQLQERPGFIVLRLVKPPVG